jgi:hypothetical protein
MINITKIEHQKEYRRRGILYPAMQSQNHEINLRSGPVWEFLSQIGMISIVIGLSVDLLPV